MAWVGPPENLMRGDFLESQDVESERAVTTMTTLAGRRVAQIGPAVRRTWSLSLPGVSTSEEIATWQAFSEGEYGPGPFTFVSDWAADVNLLTGPQSVLTPPSQFQGGTSEGGSLTLADGTRAGRSLLATSDVSIAWPYDGEVIFMPVVPGQPLTVSAYAAVSGVRIRARLYSAGQAVTRTVGGSTSTGTGQRVSASTVAEPGEAFVLILLDRPSGGAFTVARPAITWTDGLRPWGVGSGGVRVVMEGFSVSPTVGHRHMAYGGASFTLIEVG